MILQAAGSQMDEGFPRQKKIPMKSPAIVGRRRAAVGTGQYPAVGGHVPVRTAKSRRVCVCVPYLISRTTTHRRVGTEPSGSCGRCSWAKPARDGPLIRAATVRYSSLSIHGKYPRSAGYSSTTSTNSERSRKAAPRAGWISMLLLEWLRKQCNRPVQRLTNVAEPARLDRPARRGRGRAGLEELVRAEDGLPLPGVVKVVTMTRVASAHCY